MTEKEKNRRLLPLLVSILFAMVVSIILFHFIINPVLSENKEMNEFCKTKGYEKGKVWPSHFPDSFILQCTKTVKEKHCIDGFCKIIENEKIEDFLLKKGEEK